MPMSKPMTLGPFVVDEEGRLQPREGAALPAVNFVWRGRAIRAEITHGAPADGHLKLQANLGRVPSTARGQTAEERPQSFAALRTMKRNLSSTWQIRLSPSHSTLLEAETGIALPITAVNLVTELTCFLLNLAPYLDLLDEGGLTGTVKS